MKIKEFQHQPVQPDTYEASMALNQLMRIAKCGMKLHNMIDDAAEMESWVAKKIDLAGDYVKKVYNYTEGEKAGLYDDDGMSEDASGFKLVSQAKEIAKKMAGNYTGAVRQIEKLQKDLSKNSSVKQALLQFNEDAGDMDLIGDGAENLGLDPNKFDYYYDTSGAGYGEVRTKSGEAILQFEYDRDGDAEVSTMDNKTIANIKQGEQLPNNVTAKLNMIKEDAGEGHMSKSTLYHTVKYAIQLMDMINKGDDLEGWVQSKLNKAADYLQGAANYEEYQRLNPYREELDPTMMQKHAVVIQKNIDEILNKETKLDDIDTKPGMMRILAKRVNEVEKEIAKETRKKTKVKEDGHTDVPSAIRNCETIIEDAMQMKQKLETMQGELPSWMTQMIAVAASDLNDARDYLLNPTTESGIMYRAGVKKYGKAGMTAIQSAAGKGASHQEIGKIKDKYLKDAEELEEGLKDWARNTAMAGVIVAGLAGVNSINNAIDNSVPAISAMNTALEMAQDSGNDELAKMIEKDLSNAKIRLSSGKDLGAVAELQDKYAKFMKTEGLAYESRLLVSLKQQLK